MPVIADVTRSAAVAVQLLTRIPVRLATVTAADLRRSCVFFPAVGLIVAAAGVLTRWALAAPLGRAAATVLAVTVMVMITGAFHEDGLADSADGLWGGMTPERRVEIMRDSRLGTYGGAALCLSLLLRVALLAPLPLDVFAQAVVAGHVLGRAAGVLLAGALPPVADQGLGAKVIGPRGAGTWLAVGLQAVAVAAWAVGWSLWLPLAVALLAVALVRRTARRRLGGLTGDLLGAVNQVAHIGVMAAVVAVERTST
ncbi:adenosylcobinamide-GDP ribazoletransferase [soil metagenome]